MARIRITKEFRFEAAHALHNYDGLCRNIHGHSYILKVTVIGEPITDSNSPKLGMVMDFGDLKDIVNREIISEFDHALIVSRNVSQDTIREMGQMAERHFVMSYQPTCENMIIDFADRLKKALPSNVKLHSLRLNETAGSYAEWFASDNE
ncbi:6-pyruvoyl trahydropterin synthase family protein [Xiashengella succiniciproducens]|jgi:6-pyruvoyltetrahydropterin/6-carboxytetrahydropterin synthase|uniref:6-carboxy-5,6,7,8-tetrahydropterin synthase n=1 Tax=Xiashengella succiniciproducens TaxID=2949635 RepID=A0A9J6ZQK3_9BACT|nr:6-carboxytetrahydropterin synthase [Alkaliflexus sp. Ai-910]URW79806.1 6-carboxytetrahydropterin synthase [Alkaliflexus sp. Ai-910]